MKTVVNAIFLLGLLAGSVLIEAAPELEANRHLLSSAKASTSATSESNSQTGHASASASANSVGGVSTARAFVSTMVRTIGSLRPHTEQNTHLTHSTHVQISLAYLLPLQ